MLLSENVTELDRQCLKGLCGIKLVKEHIEYLGLPTNFGKKKKARFTRIIERVSVNTKGWKEKLLSPVGKEILIKAVAQAIPNYAMSCFLLPVGVCEDIEKIIRDFWWGDTKDKRKIHWISWEKLKVGKNEGGMGFKDLRSFNIAMLAKQAWRLLTNPDTLVGSILEHKYYRNSTILSAKSSDRISFAFKSILAGRDLLEKGLIWKIGDGRSIECIKDRWLPRPNEYRPITRNSSAAGLRVCDFIFEGHWNVPKLRDYFLEDDVALISTLPIPPEEEPDSCNWVYAQSGVYSVSSGYSLHRSIVAPLPESSARRDRSWIRRFWNLKIPRKVSIPVWRAWQNSLPVAVNVRSRGLKVPTACSFCNEDAESQDHLLLLCPLASQVWMEILPSAGRREEMSNIKEWIEHIFSSENLAFQQIFAVSIWVLWFHRNSIRFKGETPNPRQVLDSIKYHLGWFLRDMPSSQQTFRSRQPQSPTGDIAWKKPGTGWVKCNCDASMVPSTGKAGLGCVIRDEMGDFIAGRSFRQVFNPSVLLLELKAIHYGLVMLKEAGCRRVEIESDSQVAINLLMGVLDAGNQAFSRDIVEELEFCRGFTPWFEDCSFSYTHRSANSLAHAFAKHALDIDSSILFTEKPDWAIEHVYGFFEPVGV